jgi:hypothetical protein
MDWLGLIVETLVLVTIHYQLRGVALGLSPLLLAAAAHHIMLTPAPMALRGHLLAQRLHQPQA